MKPIASFFVLIAKSELNFATRNGSSLLYLMMYVTSYRLELFMVVLKENIYIVYIQNLTYPIFIYFEFD